MSTYNEGADQARSGNSHVVHNPGDSVYTTSVRDQGFKDAQK